MVWIWNVEFVDVATNYDDLTGGAYNYAILQLRTRLRDCTVGGVCGSSVLPVYTSNTDNIRWFDIRLYLNRSTRVRLRFRRDNLYLYGYKINNQQWRELGVDGSSPHLVDDNSSFLGFTETYTNLEHVAGYGINRLSQLILGRDALINAGFTLASASSSRRDIARALLVMILMFSESARFRPVQSYLQRTFFDNEAVPDWVDDLIHRWGTLCSNVLYYVQNPDEQWVTQTLTIEGDAPGYEIRDVDVTSTDDMLQYIALLQNNPGSIRPAG